MTSLQSLADLKTTNLKSEPEVTEDSAIKYERKVDKQGRSYATGKRKDSIAKVWLKSGSGKIIVNDLDITAYFVRPVLRMVINQPFQTVAEENKYDIMATVLGGGLSGQAGALRHGISKALFLFNPEFRAALKTAGFLTRDPRVVERKKYGRKKARRSFQFVKR